LLISQNGEEETGTELLRMGDYDLDEIRFRAEVSGFSQKGASDIYPRPSLSKKLIGSPI